MTRGISFTLEDLVILTGHKKASIRYVADVMLTEKMLKSVSEEINKKKEESEKADSES